MISIRLAMALAVAVTAACTSGNDDAPESPAPEVPMPSEQDANLPITGTFAMAQTAFVHGDVRMYALTFADSATMYVPGYGRMEGRNAIARDFGREAGRLGIREVTRTSDGRYIEGREVVDSGRYMITSTAPLPEGGIPANGRYWTRWRYSPDGTWIIVSDSIAGPGTTR
jgi:hypothetical protein